MDRTHAIQQAAEDIRNARHTVALTGAGISAESGIPPFRGKGGVWERIDPMEFATIDAFLKNPAKVWQVLFLEMKQVLDRAHPNAAHEGLARLEQSGHLRTVITQNVDGLHQAAGNTDVIEFHGNFAWQRCQTCGQTQPSRELELAAMPPRCPCGGLWRPACVLFGELIPTTPLQRSQAITAACDVMLVIGTSAVVEPAASLPALARAAGAKIIEINPEPTPLTRRTSHYLIQGKAGEIVSRIADQCAG